MNLWLWLANGVLLVHLAFVLFVVLGGGLVWVRPGWAVWHLPAAAWGPPSSSFTSSARSPTSKTGCAFRGPGGG